jgi:light-regulated signal transduction histidine kinase (bacteriophytochrome)
VEKDEKSLILQAWSTRTVSEFCRAEGKGMHYNIDQAGVWVDCVRHRRPVVHNDYGSLPHRKGLPEGHAPVFRELVVPVIKNERMVAVLGVGNKPVDYTQEDVEIVSFLADVAWEIVERKRMEEALQQMNERLERTVTERTEELEWKNRELEEFVFVASHDLQAPIRKIKIFAELLKQDLSGVLSDRSRDYLERLTGASDRMHKLINSLLNYSRSSSKPGSFKRVNLKSIAEEVAEDLMFLHRPYLEPVIEISDLPEIDADPVQMIQLFQNLLTNALHYRREDQIPEVKISGCTIESGNGHDRKICELRVEDNGIGFDMRFADEIFLPFERLHSQDKYEGTGMGLAICKKIVDVHGGKISARSTVGKGSTFNIKLPVNNQSKYKKWQHNLDMIQIPRQEN